MIKNISVLGSTGSIGTQTLDVVDKLNLNVTALTANSNVKLTEQQIRKYKPQIAVLFDEEKSKRITACGQRYQYKGSRRNGRTYCGGNRKKLRTCT